MRRPLLALALASAFMAPFADAQTLRDVLRKHRAPITTWTPAALDRRITSYAVEDASGLFFIAFYYSGADRNALPDTLQLAAFDKATATWTHGVIARPVNSGGGPDSWHQFGSVLNVRHSADFVYLDTHISPSAGMLLVLHRDMRLAGVAYGWTLQTLRDDVVLYHRSMVHFASTHPAEVWTFDARTGRDTLLYPRKPYDTVRRNYVARVKEIYTALGEDWFRVNNHHMDPERFDSSIVDSIVTDAGGTSAAFVVRFGDDNNRAAGTPAMDVAVVCRDINTPRSRCTETDLVALQRQHPGWSSARILQDIVNR